MGTLTVEPIDATLGAVVREVDLSRLDEADWSLIEAAFLEYALLVFPGQHLSESAQLAFARRFGDIEMLNGQELVYLTNQRADGSLRADGDPVMEILRGTEVWHADSTYMPLAAKGAVFSAHAVPSTGGGTEWADMRAAYDALDDETRARVAELSAYHSLHYSQARIGHTPSRDGGSPGYGFHDDPPPLRPLVKTHPVTGRPSLLIGRHAFGIPGLEPEESERLLDELVESACQPPRVHEHHWAPGDVVVWDNRCLLHRARPFDHRELRLMKHTRIAGDPASELGSA